LKVLVDTCIWSLALRRRGPKTAVSSTDQTNIAELGNLIKDVRVQLIGPIRQEILSGIKSNKQFGILRAYLRSFPDYYIQREDYEQAADFFNTCRNRGISGSNTDFLICAIAFNNNWPIFTVDEDFSHFSKVVPVRIYKQKE
jgi:predicted nucleic acid-binding protein